MNRRLREQLIVAAAAIGGGLLFFIGWGPPGDLAENLEQHGDYLAACIGFLWLAGETFLLTKWLSRRRPVVRTSLGNATFWSGIVSCVVLPTGFLFGWLAVFLAPFGAVAGIVTVVKEIRAGSGNDHRNLIGMLLCIGALVFLAA